MKVLVLSFYYPPDIGPGPLRAQSIVNALEKKLSPGCQIDVISTQPNRYETLSRSALDFESRDNVSITRVTLPRHRGGIFDQAVAHAYFTWKVLRLTRDRTWDIIVATSSRLMTASLGALLATKIRAKLYLDIRDLFVDTITDVMKGRGIKLLLPCLGLLERLTFERAHKINFISPGFASYARRFELRTEPSFFTNGIDKEFIGRNYSKEVCGLNKRVLYAGNIGDGQALDAVVPNLANELGEDYELKIIGDGSRRLALKENISKLKCNNVVLSPPVPRYRLLDEYAQADVLLLHLNNKKAFEKVIPSKIFEYAVTGKPIVAGVAGYPATFISEHIDGSQVTRPHDHLGIANAIRELTKSATEFNRESVINAYLR